MPIGLILLIVFFIVQSVSCIYIIRYLPTQQNNIQSMQNSLDQIALSIKEMLIFDEDDPCDWQEFRLDIMGNFESVIDDCKDYQDFLELKLEWQSIQKDIFYEVKEELWHKISNHLEKKLQGNEEDDEEAEMGLLIFNDFSDKCSEIAEQNPTPIPLDIKTMYDSQEWDSIKIRREFESLVEEFISKTKQILQEICDKFLTPKDEELEDFQRDFLESIDKIGKIEQQFYSRLLSTHFIGTSNSLALPSKLSLLVMSTVIICGAIATFFSHPFAWWLVVAVPMYQILREINSLKMLSFLKNKQTPLSYSNLTRKHSMRIFLSSLIIAYLCTDHVLGYFQYIALFWPMVTGWVIMVVVLIVLDMVCLQFA